MTNDDRFERDLATVVRHGAPDVAPTVFRERVAASVRLATLARPRPARVYASAAGLVVLLVAAAIVAPRIALVPPGATPSGSNLAGIGTRSPSATTPAAATFAPLAEPIANPGQVQVGQLFTASDGWVLNTDSHVFLTRSGGVAWRDVTPPGIGPNAKLNPSFFDPLHGWVGEFDDPDTADMAVWRTTDAGVTWSRAVVVGARTASWALVFQSPIVGWLATDPGGQHPKPELRWTEDGGITWSHPIDLAAATGFPVLPELAFADREHGALLTADGIVRATTDGGRTWVDAQMPVLPPIATASGHPLRYGGPTFVDGAHGFLEITVSQADGTPLTRLIYATDAAGATWHLVLQDDLRRDWDFIDASTWIGVSDGQVWTTADGGRTIEGRPSVGLPTPLANAYLSFVDQLHGFAAAEKGPACPPGHFGCRLIGPELFGTSDGGLTWSRIGDCIFTCPSLKPS
jgi:photosystem II stability/assembly factor-like uncharacterized protein